MECTIVTDHVSFYHKYNIKYHGKGQKKIERQHVGKVRTNTFHS